MLQIVLEEPGRFGQQDVAEPAAAAGEALVRIRRIGVCGTDLHAYAGRQPFFTYPRVLGHELGVEVVECPPNDLGLKAGDHCAVEPYLWCGNCPPCRLGKTNCCERLEVLGVHCDGGMQPYFSVPLHLLHKSEKLTLDQLSLVETLGIGAHAIERAEAGPGSNVLIIGAGPIGLAAMQFAQAAGANVRVLELSPQRRAFVESLGVAAIERPGDELTEIVIDATGNKQSMESAVELVAFAGRLVLVGIVQDNLAFHDPLFHRREMSILSSRNSAGCFPRIIQMIENGQIDTTPWITHRLSLANVPSEFGQLRGHADLVKAVIEVE